jgi:hypothetical protein
MPVFPIKIYLILWFWKTCLLLLILFPIILSYGQNDSLCIQNQSDVVNKHGLPNMERILDNQTWIAGNVCSFKKLLVYCLLFYLNGTDWIIIFNFRDQTISFSKNKGQNIIQITLFLFSKTYFQVNLNQFLTPTHYCFF